MRALTRVVTVTGLAWGCLYLAWRLLATSGEADVLAFGTLFGSELLGLAVFGLRAWHSWPTPPPAPRRPVAPSITVVIDATGSPVPDLRTTLVAVRAMHGRPLAVVVDERGNRWLRTVAQRLDALVLDRALDLGDAFDGVSTEWALYLRPGDVPAPDLTDRLAASCRPDVGVIQLPVHDVESSPLADDPAGAGSVEAFDQQVMRPALAARTAVPWYGDTPALIRRPSILAEIGLGPPVDDRVGEADRWWRAGLRLAATGVRVSATDQVLVETPAPRTIEERRVRARLVSVRRLRSLAHTERAGRLGWRTTPAHVAAIAIAPVAGAARVLQVATLILVLGLSQLPLDATAVGLAIGAGPAYGLRWTAQLLLGRGRLAPLSLLRSDLRWLGPTVLAVMVPTVAIPMGTAIFSLWQGWAQRLPAPAVAAALAGGAAFVGMASTLLLEHRTAVQRRAHRRVRLGMVTCRVEEHQGFLVDMSSGGVSVVLPGAAGAALPAGSLTTIAFRVPARNGRWHAVTAVVHVLRVTDDTEGGVRLGLEFDDPTAAPLDAVAEFLVAGGPDRRTREPGPHQATSG